MVMGIRERLKGDERQVSKELKKIKKNNDESKGGKEGDDKNNNNNDEKQPSRSAALGLPWNAPRERSQSVHLPVTNTAHVNMFVSRGKLSTRDSDTYDGGDDDSSESDSDFEDVEVANSNSKSSSSSQQFDKTKGSHLTIASLRNSKQNIKKSWF